jgi:hypothetical protein
MELFLLTVVTVATEQMVPTETPLVDICLVAVAVVELEQVVQVAL